MKTDCRACKVYAVRIHRAIVSMPNKPLSLLALMASLLCLPLQSRAQQNGVTLGQKWDGANGFAVYEWVRIEDREKLYSNAIAIKTSGIKASFFNTFKTAPFGQFARCGGLGCDLGVGRKIAQVDFAPRGDYFVVTRASGGLAFLLGSACYLVGNYMLILECGSAKTPAGNVDMPSIYRFVPGT